MTQMNQAMIEHVRLTSVVRRLRRSLGDQEALRRLARVIESEWPVIINTDHENLVRPTRPDLPGQPGRLDLHRESKSPVDRVVSRSNHTIKA